MAHSSTGKFDSSMCLDIQGFEEYLRRLRTIDDTIILNLNTAVKTTASQKDSEHNTKNCQNFHQQLMGAYESRNQVIHVCLSEATAKVESLKDAKKLNDNDIKVQKELKRNQTRLRMIQNELTVEQIIQDRSLKALQERCRRYVNF